MGARGCREPPGVAPPHPTLSPQGRGLLTTVAIIVAVIAAFLVLRFVSGVIKLIVVALIVAALAFFVLNGVTA